MKNYHLKKNIFLLKHHLSERNKGLWKQKYIQDKILLNSENISLVVFFKDISQRIPKGIFQGYLRAFSKGMDQEYFSRAFPKSISKGRFPRAFPKGMDQEYFSRVFPKGIFKSIFQGHLPGAFPRACTKNVQEHFPNAWTKSISQEHFPSAFSKGISQGHVPRTFLKSISQGHFQGHVPRIILKSISQKYFPRVFSQRHFPMAFHKGMHQEFFPRVFPMQGHFL